MGDIRKLARVYVWSGAVARVLLAATPLAVAAACAFGGLSISIGGAG